MSRLRQILSDQVFEQIERGRWEGARACARLVTQLGERVDREWRERLLRRVNEAERRSSRRVGAGA